MEEKCCLFVGIILYFTIITESGVIVPRALSKEESSGNGEIPLSINPLETRKKLNPPTLFEDYYDNFEGVIDPVRRPSDNDYNEPDRGVNRIDNNLPGTKPERFPSRPEFDENPKRIDDTDRLDDENFDKPLDEDSDKSVNNNKDFGSSLNEDKPINENGDKSKEEENNPEVLEKENEDEKNESEGEDTNPKESEKDNKEKEPEDVEKPDEVGKEEEKPEFDDEKKYVPEDELDEENDEKEDIPKESDEETNEDKNDEKEEIPEEDNEETSDDENINNEEEIHQDGEAGFFTGGSIFDTPFFNLEQVKKYFGHLDRALGHVFRQTIDEALLLNGTYANTTEEEVDIDGKKYVVTKSLIKGGDNHSSIYIEALSAKPKMNESEVIQDIEIKNTTHT